VLKIAGKTHYLWRAMDQDGVVLDVLVQSRRNKKAAKRLLRKLLKGQCRAPRFMITDKLKSYQAAKREIMPGVEHRQHKGLNNQLTPTNKATRTADETVQVGPPRSTLPVRPRSDQQPLPPTTPPHDRN
jgi:putative transposase